MLWALPHIKQPRTLPVTFNLITQTPSISHRLLVQLWPTTPSFHTVKYYQHNWPHPTIIFVMHTLLSNVRPTSELVPTIQVTTLEIPSPPSRSQLYRYLQTWGMVTYICIRAGWLYGSIYDLSSYLPLQICSSSTRSLILTAGRLSTQSTYRFSTVPSDNLVACTVRTRRPWLQ